MDTKRIHISGDYICDWCISRPDYVADGYFDRSEESQMTLRGGGAWYLKHLIASVTCADLKAVVVADQKLEALDRLVEVPKDNLRNFAHAYSLWGTFDRETVGKGKPTKVWRVSQLLGSRPLGAKGFQPDQPFKAPADLLVIDDLNLGYTEGHNQRFWKTAFANVKEDGQVILKHGSPGLARLFWDQLIKRFGDQSLTVVVSAASLRARDAKLSRASSWDQTLNELEFEFSNGGSSRDLAHAARVVVHYGASAVGVLEHGALKTFVFRPQELEGTWEETRPGKMFGVGSILTATLVRHLADPHTYPLFTAIAQALAAHRRAHLVGGGEGKKPLNVDFAYGPGGGTGGNGAAPAAGFIKPITAAIHEDFRNEDCQDEKVREKYRFITALDDVRAAWNPTSQLVWRGKAQAAQCHHCEGSRLLCNVTGPYQEAVISQAAEVVRRGIVPVLSSVPRASYGNFVSVDRREVESINEIRRLILNYRNDPLAKRPLSIAVFGSPGSGKSFAIQEVSREIFGDKKPLEFNLSQMHGPEDLHRAFHQVRDASIRQEIPLVFWDEFDANGMKWLSAFLAPMQDAEFFDGSNRHPFSKAIFVFAGGICHTFGKFCQWRPPPAPAADRNDKPAGRTDGADLASSPAVTSHETGELCSCLPQGNGRTTEGEWDPAFEALKGPDFISRLRGYVNILGPNRTDACDHTHVLRRALILRSGIERDHPDLIGPDAIARIAPDVIEAFLRVGSYKHGARSLNAILDMSSLAAEHRFTASALPSADTLALHVSGDFLKDSGLPHDVVERLAVAGHKGWSKAKRLQGYEFGEVRQDKRRPRTHPDLCPWQDLTPQSRQYNRDAVPSRILIFRRLGYAPIKNGTVRPLTDTEVARIAEDFSAEEHRRWLSNNLVNGWDHAPTTTDHLRLHADICRFDELTKSSKELNMGIAEHTIRALERCGYELRSSKSKGG